MLGLRVFVEMDYEGNDISKVINEEHSNFEYKDNIGLADEISFTIHNYDVSKPWINNSFPEKGDKVIAKLRMIEGDKDRPFECGEFYVDDINTNFCPDTLTIKAISIELGNKIKSEEVTKAWEKTSLKKIGQAIATKNKLKFEFKGSDVKFARVEQKEESDGALIQRLAVSHGFGVKVIKSSLVIMEHSALEKENSNVIIDKKLIKSGNIKMTDVDTYDSCLIHYYDTKLKKKIQVEVKAKRYFYKGTTGKVLKKNKSFGVSGTKAEKEAQLKKVAEGLLRQANKKDTTFSFNLKGSFDYVAGARVTLKNFGIFDKGNYIITAVSHKKDSSGYETQVEGRVCLDVS